MVNIIINSALCQRQQSCAEFFPVQRFHLLPEFFFLPQHPAKGRFDLIPDIGALSVEYICRVLRTAVENIVRVPDGAAEKLTAVRLIIEELTQGEGIVIHKDLVQQELPGPGIHINQLCPMLPGHRVDTVIGVDRVLCGLPDLPDPAVGQALLMNSQKESPI